MVELWRGVSAVMTVEMSLIFSIAVEPVHASKQTQDKDLSP